jgi:hypothetical protein
MNSLPTSAEANHGGQKFFVLHVDDDELATLNFERAIHDSEWVDGVEFVDDGLEALRWLRSTDLHGRRLVILIDMKSSCSRPATTTKRSPRRISTRSLAI